MQCNTVYFAIRHVLCCVNKIVFVEIRDQCCGVSEISLVVMNFQYINENVQESPGSSLRKSSRNRNKPNKYGDFIAPSPPKQVREVSSEDEEQIQVEKQSCYEKPSALFSIDDVEGQDMFKFKSRHTKQDLQNVVKTAIYNSPKALDSTRRTPKKRFSSSVSSPLSKVCEATPKHVKDLIKKRIIREVESDSDEGDFSGSSSDFVPEESGNESESSQSSSGAEAEEDTTQKTQKKVQIKKNRDGRSAPKESEYIVTPDNYFMMHSSKKIVTSDHTLERLKNFSINDNMEQQEDIQLTDEHKRRMLELNQSYEQLFNRWLYVLSENYNIILYGVGSKRSILHSFQQQKLNDFPCIVVNGFFPSLTMKSILESIIVDLLECSHVPSNITDVVDIIDTQLKESGMELFLIVHNIDGTMLRNSKAQGMLASVAQIKNVHMLATIDHINAPLLWDHSKLSKFNFTWWDVTTFMSYTEETSFENSLLTHRSGALQLSSLRSVYLSLTSNAKGIFNILIQHQLDNHKQAHYQGLQFKDLYSKSREQFLVSSDIALRAQLTEFLDHKLVKIKRTYDGGESLIIPIDNTLLQQFLDQQNS